jgi:nicotianamine synthase
VTACVPPSSIDVEQLEPEAQEMRGSLIRHCSEAHYSDLLADFDNYIPLSQLEYGLLARLRRLRAAELSGARGPPPARARSLRQLRHLD